MYVSLYHWPSVPGGSHFQIQPTSGMCSWVAEPRTWRADYTTALYKGLEHLLILKSAGILDSSPVDTMDTEVQLYTQNYNITLILNITEIILVFPFLCLLSRTAT